MFLKVDRYVNHHVVPVLRDGGSGWSSRAEGEDGALPFRVSTKIYFLFPSIPILPMGNSQECVGAGQDAKAKVLEGCEPIRRVSTGWRAAGGMGASPTGGRAQE